MQPRYSIPARMLGVQWSLGFSLAKEMDRTGVSLADANDFLIDFGINTPCSTCSVDFLKMISSEETRLTQPFQDWFVRARGVVAKKINRPPPTREQCEAEIQTVDRSWTAMFLMATTYPAVGQMQYYEKEIESLRRLFFFCGRLWPSWNEQQRCTWMDAFDLDYKTAPVLRSRKALLEFMVKQLVEADPDTAQRLGWYSVLNYQTWLNGQLQQQPTPSAAATTAAAAAAAPANHLDKKHGSQTSSYPLPATAAAAPVEKKPVPQSSVSHLAAAASDATTAPPVVVPPKKEEAKEKNKTDVQKPAPAKEKNKMDVQNPAPANQSKRQQKSPAPILSPQKNKLSPLKTKPMSSVAANPASKHLHPHDGHGGHGHGHGHGHGKKCVKKPVPIACFVLNLCIAIGVSIGSIWLPEKWRYVLLTLVVALLIALVVYHFV